MARLSATRPVFQSEADFQLALAWEIQRAYPDAVIRPEYRPAFLDRRGHLDLWVRTSAWTAAIEVKYFTAPLSCKVIGEPYDLIHQGAQDISRYDFVRDVERVERVARDHSGVTGFALALTNDSAYWRVPATSRETIDAAFRLHEGRVLEGRLAWADTAGAGTTRGRTSPHTLQGRYPLSWRPYGDASAVSNGTFKYLLLEVPAGVS